MLLEYFILHWNERNIFYRILVDFWIFRFFVSVVVSHGSKEWYLLEQLEHMLSIRNRLISYTSWCSIMEANYINFYLYTWKNRNDDIYRHYNFELTIIDKTPNWKFSPKNSIVETISSFVSNFHSCSHFNKY